MIENPSDLKAHAPAGRDVLSDVLRTIRLSGSLQFCFMPTGAWQTDDKAAMGKLSANPSSTIPFHIVVEGACWLKMEGQEKTSPRATWSPSPSAAATSSAPAAAAG